MPNRRVHRAFCTGVETTNPSFRAVRGQRERRVGQAQIAISGALAIVSSPTVGSSGLSLGRDRSLRVRPGRDARQQSNTDQQMSFRNR